MNFRVINYKENREIWQEGEKITSESFPKFISKDKILLEYWNELLKEFSELKDT